MRAANQTVTSPNQRPYDSDHEPTVSVRLGSIHSFKGETIPQCWCLSHLTKHIT